MGKDKDKNKQGKDRTETLKEKIVKLFSRKGKVQLNEENTRLIYHDKSQQNKEVTVQSKTTPCYVVQGDELLIGTREELEAKVTKKYEIVELDSTTKSKIEASVQVINESLKLAAEAKLKGDISNKSSVTAGPVKLTGEVAARGEATAKAMVDLSQLMIELGVEVKGGVKIKGSISLDAKYVDIDVFVEAAAEAKAGASVVANYQGVKAEAKASAEASAKLGVRIDTKEFEVGGMKYKLSIRPSIAVYARAEAKAAAAAGMETGVEIGASAAVGVRGVIEVAVVGSYMSNQALDKMVRETDQTTGKSKAKPTKIENADLGLMGMQVELELSVGAEFSMTPFSLSVETDDETGLEYAVGSSNFKIDLPLGITGPLGAGIGIKVYVKVAKAIIDDVIERVKKELKKYVLDKLLEIVKQKYEEFKEAAKELGAKLENQLTKLSVALLDFIGQHARATEKEMERQSLFLVNAFGEFMADESQDNKDYLANRFTKYQNFLENSFDQYTKDLPKIALKASQKIEELKKGDQTDEVTEAIKEMTAKVNELLVSLKKVATTEKELGVLAQKTATELNAIETSLADKIVEKGKFIDSFIDGMERTLAALNK